MDATPLTILLLFLATAPIALMPAATAFFERQPNALVILGINLVVWIALYGNLAGIVAVPIPLVLIAWLVLLRSVIKRKSSAAQTSN